jgi:hypothetical protein
MSGTHLTQDEVKFSLPLCHEVDANTFRHRFTKVTSFSEILTIIEANDALVHVLTTIA